MRSIVKVFIQLASVVIILNTLKDLPVATIFLGGDYELYTVVTLVVIQVIPLLIGVSLIIRPGLLADHLPLDESDRLVLNMSPRSFLRVGIIVIGIFLFFRGLPHLFWYFYSEVLMKRYTFFHEILNCAMMLFVQLLPVYLIFGADKLISLIEGPEAEIE